MYIIGKLNREIYRCITDDISSEEVIITDERIRHIIERRGADFWEKYKQYFPFILSDPDYIFPDNRVHTAIVCKAIEEAEGTINLVLRVAVEGENPSYHNSILTAIRENKRRFAQRLRNHIPIYKKD